VITGPGHPERGGAGDPEYPVVSTSTLEVIMKRTSWFMHTIAVAGVVLYLSFSFLHGKHSLNLFKAQKGFRKMPYFAELGGKGLLYGVFYERSMSDYLGFGVGFSAWPLTGLWTDVSATIIPIYLSWYPVGTTHRLYVDLGVDYVSGSSEGILGFSTKNPESTLFGVAGIGYNFRGERRCVL
jgi:hypothetical protein